MAQKNATLRALIEGVIYDLMPKGSVYNVWVDDTTTLAEKLAEVITSLNGKVTPEQLTAAIEEALAGFEGGGGDSPIKLFPLVLSSDSDGYMVDITSLEEKTFYCLGQTVALDQVIFFGDNNGKTFGGITAIGEGELFYTYTISDTYGRIFGRNREISYYVGNDGTGELKASQSRNTYYLDVYNKEYYVPASQYNPATKGYVDNTVSQKISEIVIPELVQGNWSQNDPTADDYIKNRTHWVEKGGLVTVLPTTELILNEDMGAFVIPNALELTSGNEYVVKFDGVEFTTLCQDAPENEDGVKWMLGDIGMMDGTPVTGEPFVILVLSPEVASEIGMGALIMFGGTASTISIDGYEEIVHTIDPKFLPGNKSPLTFTGAVEGTYDGSEALTINIPSTDEVVQAVLYSIGESKVLGTVDENNVITVTSSLGDGTYILKYENADGTTTEIGQIVIGSGGSSYVNLADTASSDWLTNKRINSSKNIVDVTESQRGDDTVVVTNFIDIVGVQKLHIKGLDVLSALSSGQNYGRFYVYDSNKTVLVASAQPSTTSYVTVADYDSSVWIIDCEAYLGEWGFADERYVRLGGILTGAAEDVIITADENIQ